MQIGISTSLIDIDLQTKSLDGVGVYTNALFKEYIQSNRSPVGFVFPQKMTNSSYHKLPASYKELALRGLNPFSKPVQMPVDIFHVTDYRGFRMSCPSITTLYDAIPFLGTEMANQKRRQLKNFFLKRSAQFADHVIAISNFSTLELIKYYGIPESKISVVYCGVDETWLTSPSQEQITSVLDKYKLQRGYFLNVGTLQPRKNVSRLIHAHNQMPAKKRKQHPLVVVGKKGWNCEELIKELQLKASIGEAIWLSNVGSREDLKCLYGGAEAFLFPSLHEGFGLPILEAFAMGVPVLTSNSSSLPEVSMGIGLEIDPFDVNQIAEGMLQLLNFPDRAKKIESGIARAKEFSWKKSANETYKVYQNVLSGKL